MNTKKVPLLSKSRFLAGLQCPLRLWFECYNPDLASEVSPVQQAVFDTGHGVGRLATRLYPGGILIEEDHVHHEEAVKSTLKAIEDPAIPAIYEAGFIHEGVRIRVDILERLNNGKWNMIEVKSSTSEKDIHLPDVAIQYHVLKGSGLDVDRVILMHLNNRYVYDGKKLELERLFSRADMTEKAIIYEGHVPSLISGFNGMLARHEAPEIKPGRHCTRPYECEFLEHCTRDIPEYWVMNLRGISQKKLNDLEAMGVEDIRDIPDSFPLSALQQKIRSCVIHNIDYISPLLKDELLDVEYPVHFLDFETIGPAIPRYAGTRPYQAVPFQWSDHILFEDGSIKHREYICEEDKDPREDFTLSLLEVLETKGSIVTYTGYEEVVIRGLAEHFTAHSERLYGLLPRIRDLHKIISKDYYHPRFQGSFSIKSVLPAILPEMSYEYLEIQEGEVAGLAYQRMIDPLTPVGDKGEIKKDLLTYCGHDTLAMVKIREELLQRFK